MQKRCSGQIAIFSSGAGFCAEPLNPIYSATKVALTAYGESLRYIMRDYNVFVSIVDPGAVRTPMAEVPYLRSMQSSLAPPEGMAKTLRKGLKRDFMHIGYTTSQHWTAVTLFGDMPYTAKDFVFRALIPSFKAANQYLIEFHPSENWCVCKKNDRFPSHHAFAWGCCRYSFRWVCLIPCRSSYRDSFAEWTKPCASRSSVAFSVLVSLVDL